MSMSTYEELQLIVSATVPIVAILNYTHKKQPSIPDGFHLPIKAIKPLIHKGFISKLPAGLEPATYALRMRCSTN